MPNTKSVAELQNDYDSMVYDKLLEAERQAASTFERYTHEEVMAKAMEILERNPLITE